MLFGLVKDMVVAIIAVVQVSQRRCLETLEGLDWEPQAKSAFISAREIILRYRTLVSSREGVQAPVQALSTFLSTTSISTITSTSTSLSFGFVSIKEEQSAGRDIPWSCVCLFLLENFSRIVDSITQVSKNRAGHHPLFSEIRAYALYAPGFIDFQLYEVLVVQLFHFP